jgi:hypothetical protein
MSQSRDLITCCSAKENECLIMNQSESLTMCQLADESECLIMSQSRVSTMCHSAEEKKALIMKKKVIALKSCFVAIQNDSDETDDAVSKFMKIYKCFNSLIQNDVLILSFVDFASYFFKNLT